LLDGDDDFHKDALNKLSEFHVIAVDDCTKSHSHSEGYANGRSVEGPRPFPLFLDSTPVLSARHSTRFSVAALLSQTAIRIVKRTEADTGYSESKPQQRFGSFRHNHSVVDAIVLSDFGRLRAASCAMSTS
jgi:hypothetical protein